MRFVVAPTFVALFSSGVFSCLLFLPVLFFICAFVRVALLSFVHLPVLKFRRAKGMSCIFLFLFLFSYRTALNKPLNSVYSKFMLILFIFITNLFR